jgi:hypothetical protein
LTSGLTWTYDNAKGRPPRSNSNIYAGEVVFYDWDGNGQANHSALCTGIDFSNVSDPMNIVCAHDNNHKDVEWNLFSDQTNTQKQNFIYKVVRIYC